MMKTTGTISRREKRSGLTLIESMVLLVVLSIVSVGAGVGLQSVAKVPGQTDDVLAVNSAVISVMEQMRATPYGSLPGAATTWNTTKNPITINNKNYPLNVSVATADPDGNGVEPDFSVITVTIGTESMSVYVTQP